MTKAKIYILSMLVAGVSFGLAAYAEENTKAYDIFKQEIGLTIAALETQRKIAIYHNLKLSKDEARAFTPVYNDYRKKMQRLNNERVRIITDYADAYRSNTLSDKMAMRLLNSHLNALQARQRIKKSFVGKFRKVLSGKQVARFFQLDHRLDLLIDMEIAKGIPLVE